MRLLLFVFLIVGCGVNPPSAPRDGVKAVELRDFPAQDWRLVNNRLFLWKESMTPADVSQAQAISRTMDDLDTQAVPLNRRNLELEKLIDPLKEKGKELARESRRLKSEIDKLEVAGKTEEAKTLKVARAKVEGQIRENKAKLEPLETELGEVEVKRMEIEMKGRERVEEIQKIVEWYKDQPTAVSFRFEPDGTISAGIAAWNLGDDDGPRNFTTDNGTIRNVAYEPRGGIFTMEAVVFTDATKAAVRETYTFRLARLKYDDPMGRTFFGGEMTRVKNGEIRRGLAKLVDRNN